MTDPHPLLQWFAVIVTALYVGHWLFVRVLVWGFSLYDRWETRNFVNDGFGRDASDRRGRDR